MRFSKPFEHSQELFDAALNEFIERGYEQASINTILQNAGMSKGQFYYHFENKESLYLALIGVVIEQKRAFLAQVMKPEDFQQDIFGIFRTQIHYGLAFAREHPAINRFAESFVKEHGSAIYKKALATYNFNDNEGISQLVEFAYQRGEFRQDLPLPVIKRMIGYLFTHAVDLVDLNNPDTYEDELNYLIEFIKTGLTGKVSDSSDESRSERS